MAPEIEKKKIVLIIQQLKPFTFTLKLGDVLFSKYIKTFSFFKPFVSLGHTDGHLVTPQVIHSPNQIPKQKSSQNRNPNQMCLKIPIPNLN